MLKVYEKPKLVALSVSSNDSLCASCVIDTVGTNADQDYLNTIRDIAAFHPLAGDEETCEMKLSQYCKFTSSNILVNS